jgi:hypothetical protein
MDRKKFLFPGLSVLMITKGMFAIPINTSQALMKNIFNFYIEIFVCLEI